MLTIEEVIKRNKPLITHIAIQQRERRIKDHRDAIECLEKHDYSKAIAREREIIRDAKKRLEQLEARQLALPDSLQAIRISIAKLRKQIQTLRPMLPRDAAGKIAKRLKEFQSLSDEQRLLALKEVFSND